MKFVEMSFKNKERNDIIKAKVSEQEKALIKEKSTFYGYKTVAHYLRDCAIYEKVTYINIKHIEQICSEIAEYTKEVYKVRKVINHLKKFLTVLSYDQIMQISQNQIRITKNQKKIISLLEEKLKLDIYQKVES